MIRGSYFFLSIEKGKGFLSIEKELIWRQDGRSREEKDVISRTIGGALFVG